MCLNVRNNAGGARRAAFLGRPSAGSSYAACNVPASFEINKNKNI